MDQTPLDSRVWPGGAQGLANPEPPSMITTAGAGIRSNSIRQAVEFSVVHHWKTTTCPLA